jgi:hypothetical protein
MIKTSGELRRRLSVLAIRINELRAADAQNDPNHSISLGQFEAERAYLKMLLLARQRLLQHKVINLARWRDGFTERANAHRWPFRPAAEDPLRGWIDGRRRDR